MTDLQAISGIFAERIVTKALSQFLTPEYMDTLDLRRTYQHRAIMLCMMWHLGVLDTYESRVVPTHDDEVQLLHDDVRAEMAGREPAWSQDVRGSLDDLKRFMGGIDQADPNLRAWCRAIMETFTDGTIIHDLAASAAADDVCPF